MMMMMMMIRAGLRDQPAVVFHAGPLSGVHGREDRIPLDHRFSQQASRNTFGALTVGVPGANGF